MACKQKRPAFSPEVPWHGMQTEEARLHAPPMQPHRDSEKADGMFATLSIILPSTYEVRGWLVAAQLRRCGSGPRPMLRRRHAAIEALPSCVHDFHNATMQGGELVIEHDQRWRVKVDLSEESRNSACFTAFYAGWASYCLACG